MVVAAIISLADPAGSHAEDVMGYLEVRGCSCFNATCTRMMYAAMVKSNGGGHMLSMLHLGGHAGTGRLPCRGLA